MWKLWVIQLFWLALALPGYAVLQRWDPESLRRGFLFALGRCYLASIVLLTPVSVLGYWQSWPLWSLSAAYVCGVLIGAAALVRDRHSLRAAFKPNVLAAASCVIICFDLWLGLRAGAHTQGDAGYHIARVRMLVTEGLSNWDPIVAQQRLDIIYHTNWYHALIAVSAQLTNSDAALAWLATWPFAKLLAAAGVAQLACCAFGSASYGWLAALAVIVAQSPYSALPFPNTLAPLAFVPMGLTAAADLLAGTTRSPRAAAWLAASAVALAQLHALNAIFLAMIVGPILLGVLVGRAVSPRAAAAPDAPVASPLPVELHADDMSPRAAARPETPEPARDKPAGALPSRRALVLGMLACCASLPWLVVAGGERVEGLLRLALPTLQGAAPLPQPKPKTDDAQPEAKVEAAQPETPQPEAAGPAKVVYKAERFRKLANGMSVYDPGQLRGLHNANVITALVLLITLALRPRRELGAIAVSVAMTCAWLLVPPLCSVLLFVTGAPWAALRIGQVLPVAFFAVVPAAALFWSTRVARSRVPRAARELPLSAAALLLGFSQISHGEPWTAARLWEHAWAFEARSQWQNISAKQNLLCANIPPRETVMAHPRWDYGMPMHCRNFVVALAPGRGWHGLLHMPQRRADVDEFFRDGTSGPRRLDLLRKYQTRYVYTSQRIARRIVGSLPKVSRILAQSRDGAVLAIEL